MANAELDAQKIGTGSYSSLDSLVEQWSYNAEAGFGPVTPLVVDDYVIVPNRRGEVHAIDRTSGKRLGVKKFGDAINGTPAISKDLLVIPLDYGEKRSLKVWNLTGAKTAFEIAMPSVRSDVLLDGKRAYVVDGNSVVHCLSVTTGEECWTSNLDAAVPVFAAPVAIDEGRLAVVDSGGDVWIIRASDGRLESRFEIGATVVNNFAVGSRRLIIPTTDGRLIGLDPDDGATHLLFESSDPSVQLSAPVMNGSRVVFGATDGLVRCVDGITGREVWQTDVGAPVAASPAMAGRAAYVGTLGHTVLGLRMEDGSVFWQATVRGRIKSPLVFVDDELFVLSEPRFLYRFGKGGPIAQHAQ
ncbi:MAG: PQQ-binding-like beta-propeller repeat protein [Bacteroidetes bacterium]|nr:PQQ-binding-like beta-propeller repeat protein [Bacteroidota bacterium]